MPKKSKIVGCGVCGLEHAPEWLSQCLANELVSMADRLIRLTLPVDEAARILRCTATDVDATLGVPEVGSEARLRAVQSHVREKIHSALCDDMLDLERWHGEVLPQLHDALHYTEGYAPSECFTEVPILLAQIERLKAQLREQSI